MATAVIMPRQGQSVETCIITKWFRQKGDRVSAGDLLFSYETDKAAFDVEAPCDGLILDIFQAEGSEVPVLSNVAVIGSEGESAAAFSPGAKASATVKEENNIRGHVSAAAPVKEDSNSPDPAGSTITHNIILDPDTAAEAPGSRLRISPRARLLAEEKGIDISVVSGTGPNGRIIVSDIQNAGNQLQSKAPIAADAGEYRDVQLSNVRKLIAKAMHASLQNSAQLTHHMSADARKILEARNTIKKGLASGSEKQDVTLNDILCWCVLRALAKFPELNSHFTGDSIRTFGRVHLGLAVDTARGLMVPALKNADGFHIRQLAKELKANADACRKGNIDPELLRSEAASFTVSNLGNYGVEMFTPVINLPQVAILGICTITHRPADLGNSTFGFIPFIGLSLTYDHRAVDGGPATLFLREIKEQIENFSL